MDSCYLCGSSDVKFEGYFVADKDDDSVNWLMGKVKAGKKRVFVVHLCGRCFNLHNKETLILKVIESDVKMRTGYSVEVKK